MKGSSVKIVKDEATTAFKEVQLGAFFEYHGDTYMRYEGVIGASKPLNSVRVSDGSSVRFEPEQKVKVHTSVEIRFL